MLNQPVLFSAGQATRTFTVSTTNDSAVESSETFGVIIQRNPTDPVGTFLDSSTFTINDNDAAATTYSLTPSSTTVSEGAGTLPVGDPTLEAEIEAFDFTHSAPAWATAKADIAAAVQTIGQPLSSLGGYYNYPTVLDAPDATLDWRGTDMSIGVDDFVLASVTGLGVDDLRV